MMHLQPPAAAAPAPTLRRTNDLTWRRAGAASGAVGAAVYVASAFAGGSPLAPDASATEIAAHLREACTGLLLGFLLASIAVTFLLWFLGYLRDFLAVEGGAPALANATFASWIALLAIILGGTVPLAAIVWRGAGGLDPALVQLAFDANNLSLYALSAGAALVSVLAPIIVIWRSGVLPRWLVVLGAIEIAANVVELGGMFTRSGFNAAGYAGGVGPFLWILWVGALSITMTRRVTAAD